MGTQARLRKHGVAMEKLQHPYLILLMDIWKLWERMDGPAVCQIGMLGNYEERVLLSVSGLNNS